MKLYLNGKEVTTEELREAMGSLETCGPDGGDYEEIVLEEIDEEGGLHFEVAGQSTYG